MDEKKNVIQVGTQLQNELLERGIGAEHSTTNVTAELKKKGWSYAQSYSLTREIVQEATTKEKSLVYLIDIHRDSQARKITTLEFNGIEYARLFFVAVFVNIVVAFSYFSVVFSQGYRVTLAGLMI